MAHCVGPCSALPAAWVLSASLGAGPISAFLLSSDLSPEDAGGSPSPSLAVTLQPECEAGGVPPQARLVILRYLLPGPAAHAWITFCILQDNLQLWGHKAENAGLQQHAAPNIAAVTPKAQVVTNITISIITLSRDLF